MEHLNDQKKYIYFTVFNGCLRRQATEADDKKRIIERPNPSNNSTFKEVLVKGLSGFIDELKISKNKKGEEVFEIVMADDSDYYSIRLHPKSKEAERFCLTLPNLDLDKLLYFSPQKFDKDGTTKFKLILEQNGSRISAFHTLKEPNGLPMPAHTQFTEGGKISDEEYAELKEKRVHFFKEVFTKYAEKLKIS